MHRSLSFFLVSIILSVAWGSSGLAAQGTHLPTGFSDNSDYSIRYDDWDLLLSSVVLDVGLSDRKNPGRNALRNTSTRIRHGNYSATAYEGNRVLFNEFEQSHKDSLLAIRKDLEAVPDFVPLNQFSRVEQLAYWLNLHNVAVMLEVAQEYPVKRVKSLQQGRKQVWTKKTMLIDGVPISIRDIEEHVISNWDDPLVLYGFFMGAVGGPNIRDHAFTGGNVVDALRSNAVEFVNSLRGFRLWSGRGRVSDHYELGVRYFPDFENDIRTHMARYAHNITRKDIDKATSVRMDYYDWGIADLKNGDFYHGSSFNTNSRALGFFIETPAAVESSPVGCCGAEPTVDIGNFGAGELLAQADSSNIAPQTRALLRAMKIREERRSRRGTVTVEEFVSDRGGRIERRTEGGEPSSGESDQDGKIT